MRIVICDDDVGFQRYFKQQIEHAFLKRGWEEVEIQCYRHPCLLLEDKREADIYFLDIEMPEMDGIALASVLKDRSEGEFVFISSHSELIQYSMKAKPVAFVKKEMLIEDLSMALDAFQNEYVRKHKSLMFLDGKRTIMLQIREIVYFSSEKDYILAHLLHQDDISFRQKMKTFTQEMLQYGFLRIHNRYLINIRNLNNYSVRQRTAVMENGVVLPISRSYAEDVEKYCLNWFRGSVM